jgi:hypothetical protein
MINLSLRVDLCILVEPFARFKKIFLKYKICDLQADAVVCVKSARARLFEYQTKPIIERLIQR